MRTTPSNLQLPYDAGLVETANRDLLAVGPLLAGLAAVTLLLVAVMLGIRNTRNKPAPPRPDEQPHLPESGPVVELQEHAHEEEMPHDGRRLRPHEIRSHGVTTEDTPEDTPEDDPPPFRGGREGS